jgi:hypothetical protein
MDEGIVQSGRKWAQEVIDLYKQGASDAEVAASQNVTIKSYYKEIENSAAFAQLVEMGRTLSQAFWEGQARKNITNKQFNTPLWAFYMKNKFGWADKSESTNTNEVVTGDLDSLRAQVTKDVAKFLKQHTPELTDAQRVLKQIGMQIDEDLSNE